MECLDNVEFGPGINPPMLHIFGGDGQRSVALDKAGIITIGCAQLCDIPILEEGIAAVQAIIQVDDQGVIIETFTPNTYINERLMMGKELVLWTVSLKFGKVPAYLQVDPETTKAFIRNSNKAVEKMFEAFGLCPLCKLPHQPDSGVCPRDGTLELPSGARIPLSYYAQQFADEVRRYAPPDL